MAEMCITGITNHFGPGHEKDRSIGHFTDRI
jgi:hypothetical protein